MFTVIIRAVIIYAIVLVVLRLMGKRQIGEMQPFELVITLIIAEIACVPMSDTAIPLYFGVLPILLLLIVHYVISFLSRKSVIFRKVIDGKAVAVITPDGIDYIALKRMNMDVNDLLEEVNNKGFFSLAEIYYAAFETNGKFSIIPRAFFAPLTCGDMKVDKEQTSPPLPVVIDGKTQDLKKAALTEARLGEILADAGVKRLKDIALMTLDYNGHCYIQPKNGTYVYKKYLDLSGGSW